VREHDTSLVWLERRARDEASPDSRDPVRADELLLEQPDGGRVFANQHALSLPLRQQAGGLGGIVRTNEPHGVVRAPGEELLVELRRDDVVRGRDEVVERGRRARGVPEGAKRLHERHRGQASSRRRT
jgi:hypothetical protein